MAETSYHNSRDVGRKSLEVMKGGRGVSDDEVEGDEQAAKDDTERAADDGEENILLEHYSIPRRPVIYISRHDRRPCNENI